MVERQGQDPQHGHDQGKQTGGQHQQQNDPKHPGQQGGQPRKEEPGGGQSGHDKGKK